MKRVFLLLSTNNIGGAEKRFAGLWRSANEANNNIKMILVGSKQLLYALQKQEGFGEKFERANETFIEHDLSGNFKSFQRSVKTFVKQHTNDGDVLHFIGDHPLCRFSSRKLVYSITQSSFKNLNASGKLGQLGGVALSDTIDVLDPNIYSFLQKVFFYKRRNIFRTSNSYCDASLFSPLPYSEKKDWFVFLGRFEVMKQVKQLLQAIPSLYQNLNGIATNELHFYILGHGSMEEELKQMLTQEKYKNLPATVGYTDKPHEVLKQSKFFFSLQLHNNYPSRSLIEAMAAGNIPIVTDVGQTRWLAKPEFSFYVPEHFTETDMLKTVSEIYCEGEKILAEKSRLTRQFVMNEHTIDKMRDYYLNLYNKV